VAIGDRLLPVRIELDLADEKMTSEYARYIKNLTFAINDTSEVTDNKSSQDGKYRPLESTQVFDDEFSLPAGYNHFLGAYSAKDENCVIFHYYNDQGSHAIYIIYGETQVVTTVYLDACLEYQLNPEHFIHEGGAWLEVFKYNDPTTGLPRKRSYYNFTDGYNYMRFVCIEDAIATSGFNPSLHPYFVNPHDKCLLINAGLEPPKGCMTITEVPNDNAALQNNLRFNTWQFMVRYIDVYGRPSEWGDISDLYIPGDNDCIGSSELLPRCLDLTFDAGNPLVNIIEVAFRNCNDPQWYRDNSLFLYKGTNLGDWWKRGRNPTINYNPVTNEVTYRFCKDKECDPIPQEETNRTENPLPRVTQSVAKIGKFLGVGNNKHGFFPFGDDIMDDINLAVTQPSTTNSDVRNIEIYVPIINPFTQTYQPVYADEDGEFVWGGRYYNINLYVPGVKTAYEQNFGLPEQKGFIGYLAGTGEPPTATISEMYYVDDTTNQFVKVDDFNIVFNPPFVERRWYHKFTFNSVPKAEYVFRIADHRAQLTDTDFQNTSTYIYGSFPWNNKTTAFNNQSSQNWGASSLSKELIVDVCTTDYNSVNDTKVLAIFDLTHPGEPGNQGTKVSKGYVYERINPLDNEFQFPVELLQVSANKNGDRADVISGFTDHNGFYFTADGDNNQYLEFFGNCGCANYKKLASFQLGNDNEVYVHTFAINGRDECPDFYDKACTRVKITGTIKECGSGIPVPGVGVVYTRGGYAVTGADGTFTIIAHRNNISPAATRVDNLYYIPTTCPFTDCADGCVEIQQVILVPCVSCDALTITTLERSVAFDTKMGLLSGGNYGVALWGSDWLGRHQFAQTRDKFYFTTPTLIQTRTFAPSIVTITINPNVTFPDWVDELKFGITQELTMGGVYMTWITDRIEFIDNSGNVNNIAPTQIKIYYGSLIEYNTQNNFNTTTGWQFIVQDDSGVNTEINYTSDFVEFYVNGDGQFFPTLVRALIKYDSAGQYFLIDYDSKLADLKPYGQIRIGRPLKCSTKDVFYQVCGTIKVINGKAQQNTLVLNAFDTYYKYRQIPIPVGTEEEPENVIRTFGFPFEHHSPSDFWGDHCINIGKINVRNPYESEIFRENQVMLSGALSVNGQLNYLNYFDERLAIDFDNWDFGGIVSIRPFVGGIRCICQYNHFTVGFNDNMLRVDENGRVTVPSADSKFGNPEVKIGNNFGCSFWDKNTIRSKDGLIQYVDSREGTLMQDNYQTSTVVSQVDEKAGVVGGINSWLVAKIKYMERWNRTQETKKYFTGSIDPAARAYLLTDFEIGSTVYVNEERGVKIEAQETLQFDYSTLHTRQFIGYTPQGYGYLEGQLNNIQLFSFTNKVNYHYTTALVKTYNTFYGVVCNRVIRPVVVLDGFQKKQFTVLTVMGNFLYFCDTNRTDSGQQSRILIANWDKGLNYFSAPILCNLLTLTDPNLPNIPANNIFDGDKMYGSIFDFRMIGDPSQDTINSELQGFVVEAISDQKIIP